MYHQLNNPDGTFESSKTQHLVFALRVRQRGGQRAVSV
jgi:hypothetical protein